MKKEDFKKKKVKRRTFLGCATCRNRKVKCDGRHPTCLRCEKAGKECLGYGFKLKFTDPMTVEEDGSLGILHIESDDKNSKLTKRQQLTLMKFPVSQRYATFDEIDIVLENLETHKCKGEFFSSGPFGKFGTKKFQQKDNTLNSEKSEIVSSQINSNLKNIRISMDKENKNILPPLISIINSNTIDHSRPQNFLMSKIIPLVPALELHYKRKKQQNERNGMSETASYLSIIEKNKSFEDNNSCEDGIIPRPIWIHPRLEIDAILTYQTLMGSADAVTNSWDLMKSIIFAEKYNMVSQLKNRIIDKMRLTKEEINFILNNYNNEVLRALDNGTGTTHSIKSFTALLRSQRVQELIRLFVKSQPRVLILSFNGSIFDTIVIPLLYKIVGELMVFECSVGLHADWIGKVREDGIEFREYCDTLKRTYCMVTLSITAFSQYKVLFNEYGIYDGSLSFFRCYIAFREMTLVNLSILIKPLIDTTNNKINVNNESLVSRLIKVSLFKELILTLILAIYQDSNVDIINNYSLLYSVLEGLRDYYDKSDAKDKEINELWEWFRYLHIFYKSCSKIDLDNYEINEEGFEDVKSDYNLIKKFKFDDHFDKSEFNKIEIEPRKANDYNENENNKMSHLQHDEDYDTDDAYGTDNEATDGSSYFINDDTINMQLPSRLAKRPNIIDKPPKSFTIRFHFSQDNANYDESDSDGNFSYSSETLNLSEPQNNLVDDANPSEKVLLNSKNGDHVGEYDDLSDNNNNRLGKVPTKISNKNNEREKEKPRKLNGDELDGQKQFNQLTGLSMLQSKDMDFNDREQLSHNEGKIYIAHPSSSTQPLTSREPSNIELSFGLPISLLELIERSVKLADHKNWCLRKKIFPRNFPRFCCDLEEDLINWKLEWDLFTENRSTSGDLQFHSLFHKALYHLAVSFYNTTLMFFFRLIKEIDPNLLQNHVTSTITHLEELRNLSLRSDFLKDMKLSPPFWCFFISGSDAISSQLRYRFDEVARKTFVAGNKWIGKQIMMEIWKNAEEAENHNSYESTGRNSWLDMIKDWEVSGFN